MRTMLVELRLDGDAAPMVGAELLELGLRARCASVVAAGDRDDHIDVLVSEGAGPGARYEVTGSVGDVREISAESGGASDDGPWSEFVMTIRVAGVELHMLGEVVSTSADTWIPGSRVTANCGLSVIKDYEWDAFGLPQQVRGSWRVDRSLPIDDNSVCLDLIRI